jgi:alpha-amylase
VPPLDVVVLRADRRVGTDDEADAVTVRVRPEVSDRAAVDADVADGAHHEVTFAVSVDGGPFTVLGVDDSAPYGLRHDVRGLPAGAALTYRAIAVDAKGNVSAASAASKVAAPG